MVDRERLNEAIGLLSGILNSPTVVSSLSEVLDQRRQPATMATSNATVNEEMQRLFRAGTGAPGSRGGPPSGGGLVNTVMRPRYQTQQHFGGWASKSRKRSTVPNHPTFNKDVVLLPKPDWDEVCKFKTKRRLHESGNILSAFEISKSWDCQTVIAEIREAFKDKIPVDASIELLMPCGNKLISPKLREGQELNGIMIHKVFKSKAIYIRPSRMLPFSLDSSDSEDICKEVDSTPSDHGDCMNTRATESLLSSTQQVHSYPFTRARANQPTASQSASCDTMTETIQVTASQAASCDTMACTNQPITSQPALGLIDSDHVTTVNQIPSPTNDNYAAYVAIMSFISDHSSDDEELTQAIMASLENQE